MSAITITIRILVHQVSTNTNQELVSL